MSARGRPIVCVSAQHCRILWAHSKLNVCQPRNHPKLFEKECQPPARRSSERCRGWRVGVVVGTHHRPLGLRRTVKGIEAATSRDRAAKFKQDDHETSEPANVQKPQFDSAVCIANHPLARRIESPKARSKPDFAGRVGGLVGPIDPPLYSRRHFITCKFCQPSKLFPLMRVSDVPHR
jgi:hypothetical protein